ncbi:hypothetical protein [Paenibacillus agricola]|uniref:Methyl-accepting chemotaxis protein n=1 Tax=Paenibacillus agricola TaxID=2716264 RepID=A0ABX0J467_9BACL|nr:hypothetical protein [Paenibacillus agricola]NHN31177.1 hypothetical protein [Paenibacillus agricola]
MFQTFQSRINRLSRASLKSLATFTKTDAALTRQNEMLSETITEVNDEIIRLTEIHMAAEGQRRDNSGIILRIRRIISG